MARRCSLFLAVVVFCAVLAGAPSGAWAAADLRITSFTTSPKPMTTPDATVTITATNSGDTAAAAAFLRFEPSMGVEEVLSIICPPDFMTGTVAFPGCFRGVIAPGAVVTMVVGIRLTFDAEGGPPRRIIHHLTTGEAGSLVPFTDAYETVPVAFDTGGGGEPGAGRKPGAGAEPGGGAEPGATTPRAPQLTALSLSPSSFRAAAGGPSAFAARARVGTLVTTRLSAAATETFRVERAVSGRRVGGRCRVATRSNRHAPRCTRWPVLSGRFTAQGAAGTNRLRFTGRLAGLRLAPGHYRLTVTARDSARRTSTTRRAAFTIVG